MDGGGETHWGCLSQYAHLKSAWLVPLPTTLTPQQAMNIGTAGYTAALCVQRIIEHGVKPEQGTILVTGATGGGRFDCNHAADQIRLFNNSSYFKNR